MFPQDKIGTPQSAPVAPQGGNQGLDQILQALAIGGQPLGEMANMQSALPQGGGAQVNPMQEQIGTMLEQLTPEQVQVIMEALGNQGVFNSAPNTGV